DRQTARDWKQQEYVSAGRRRGRRCAIGWISTRTTANCLRPGRTGYGSLCDSVCFAHKWKPDGVSGSSKEGSLVSRSSDAGIPGAHDGRNRQRFGLAHGICDVAAGDLFGNLIVARGDGYLRGAFVCGVATDSRVRDSNGAWRRKAGCVEARSHAGDDIGDHRGSHWSDRIDCAYKSDVEPAVWRQCDRSTDVRGSRFDSWLCGVDCLLRAGAASHEGRPVDRIKVRITPQWIFHARSPATLDCCVSDDTC